MKRFYFMFCLGAFLSASQIYAQSDYIAPDLPVIPNKVFNIQSYGAVSDNSTDNTQAIQTAINTANRSGGGCVEIPAGTYLCGPIQLFSNLKLQIDSAAVLRLLPINLYPGGLTEGKNFIVGEKLHDIAITGKGTIDGQGSPWWIHAKESGMKRPKMIVLRDCNRILIEGVTLKDSPMFHIAISGKTTTNVTVSGVIVRAPASDDPINPSHNTDACDVTGRKILIKNCDISTGDDDYTCGGGTSDVFITNCKYGYGHGLSIGSYTQGVSNITVENCTFENTECGIRIKSDRDRGGIVKNMTYSNLTMKNVGIPILIYGAYNAKQPYRNLQKLTSNLVATYPAAPITDKTPVFQDITFRNITATVKDGKRAGLIWGLPEAPATNILLQNVKINAENAFGIYFAKNVQVENCDIRTSSGKNKFDIAEADVTVDGKKVK